MHQLPPQTGQVVHGDAVEVAEVARTVRRGWRAVIAFTVLGVIAATVVVLFAPPRFTGKASVLVRSGGSDVGGGLLAKIAGSVPGGDLSGIATATMETELQVIKSRVLAQQVVDSLQLQFRVREPRALSPLALVRKSVLRPSFEPRVYAFARGENGRYRVEGSETVTEMVPGQPLQLEVGVVTFESSLPDAFTIKVYDEEDAVNRFLGRLSGKKSGGDVALISYSANDRLTAESAPNALIAFYLEQRKTVDRGTNERRVEYLANEFDTVSATLSATEHALRRAQERSGVLDMEINGQVELESSTMLRNKLVDMEVEAAAITALLARLDSGLIKPRHLAAHPAFMRGSAVSPLITSLGDLESFRVRLLERRTELDPEVVALDQSIKTTEASLVSTSRSYATTLRQQVTDMRTQLDSVQRTLVAMPAAIEDGGRLKRDILRLSQILAGVQAQLVQARLAAIGEGGFVRQLDVAFQPRKPSFPEPWLTFGTGIVGGLFMGMVAALILGWFGRWLRDPMEIERATGLIAQRLETDAPLLMAGIAPRTMIVMPINEHAQAGLVTEQLVRTARSRALNPTVLDLSRAVSNGNGSEPKAISAVIDQLEQQHGMVVVQLPGLANEATVAALRENRPVVLVAPPGRVNRAQLEHAVQTLRRLQVPCAGVVITDDTPVARNARPTIV